MAKSTKKNKTKEKQQQQIKCLCGFCCYRIPSPPKMTCIIYHHNNSMTWETVCVNQTGKKIKWLNQCHGRSLWYTQVLNMSLQTLFVIFYYKVISVEEKKKITKTQKYFTDFWYPYQISNYWEKYLVQNILCSAEELFYIWIHTKRYFYKKYQIACWWSPPSSTTKELTSFPWICHTEEGWEFHTTWRNTTFQKKKN